MTENKLALHGGKKVINYDLSRYNSIGAEEARAVQKVIESGNLSQFIGAWSPDFYGGPMVQEFEKLAADYFDVENAISVNSWTSGLITAVASLDIEPGDEIIVSPFTMCASATSIILNNAIPVFADIEEDKFCIDPSSIEANISDNTKAIMAIDIFGQSADIDAINSIAKKHDLKVISDCAQAPATFYKNKFSGTLTDIGGFSLNYHKHIHTGEGGIIVTNDGDLAERCRLIRNHAEAVVHDKGEVKISNMLGYNFRLGEIEASIGIEQLKKLNGFVENRQIAAQKLIDLLHGLEGIHLPVVRDSCTHAFYIFPMRLDLDLIGVDRAKVVDALRAEGLDGLVVGYQNIHMLPMYQKKLDMARVDFLGAQISANEM